MPLFFFRARREECGTGAYVYTRGFEPRSNAAMEGWVSRSKIGAYRVGTR